MSVRLRLAARDPGAANVIAGLFLALPGDVRAVTDIWCIDKAADRLGALGPSVRLFGEGVSEAQLDAAWRVDPAGVLVTGTSHYVPFDSLLWRVARHHGAASLALLDAWANLPPRFRDGYPDRIGALDPRQADDVAALGYSRDQVIVTGHPWLARAARTLQASPVVSPPRSGDQLRVLFVSERIHDDVAEGTQPDWGFDETDSLVALLDAAGDVARRRPIEVMVKFHPYEDPSRGMAAVAARPPLPGLTVGFIPPGESPAAWVDWADLVAGMTSIVLVEGILAGKPVVSIQPGLIREMMYPPAALSYTDALTHPETVVGRLEDLLRSAHERDNLVAALKPFAEAVSGSDLDGAIDWIRRAGRFPAGERT